MSSWCIERTETFVRELRKFRKYPPLLIALDKKLLRLHDDPHNVGGLLGGDLHGKRSTRLLRRLRLIFRIDEQEHTVYLEALDHHGSVYD